MKIKEKIFYFLLGGIIFSSISVIAISSISADKITYNGTTVDLVLDNLYTSLNNRNYTFGEAQYNTSSGTAVTSRNTTLNLTKGKYLILRNETTGWKEASTSTTQSSSGPSTKTLTCSSNNCTIQQLTGYYNNQITGVFGSFKFIVSNAANMFYVEIKENTDVITASMGASTNDTAAVQYITLEATPIN